MNKEELDHIISEINRTKKQKEISIRELHNALGWEKRSNRSIPYAKQYLLEKSIITEPDLENTWSWYIDSKIKLKFKYTETTDNFRLYYLRVVGYKNLNINLDLLNSSNYCCLIGLNGSGKSNVLEAISRIFFSLYHIATLKDGLRKYPCKFYYTIRYSYKNTFYEITNGQLENGERITVDVLPKNIIASYSGEDTRLWKECYKPLYEKYRSTMVATPGFVPPYMFYISRYEWEISLLTLLYSEDVDVIKFIKETLGITNCTISFEYNTTNFRKWEGTNIEALIDTLRETALYSIDSFREKISNISFIDRASTLFYCMYKCRTEGDNQVIKKINISCGKKGNLEGLSEGEKKLINANVVIHILSTQDSLCLFDEPDAHIHISRQKDLKQLFKDYNRYSIVTTHSPVFIDVLSDSEKIRFMENGRASSIDMLQTIKEMSGGVVNYFDGAFILSSKKILVTEGPYDKKYIEKAIDILSKTKDPRYQKLTQIAILPSNSAGQSQEFFSSIINPMIDKIEKVVFLFDYDEGGYDGWKKIDNIGSGKITPIFYQDNYGITLDTSKKPDNKDTIQVEDMFLPEAYAGIVSREHLGEKKTHKDFRLFKTNLSSAIKTHIENNYSSFGDSCYDGFEPLLKKLLELFSL